MPRPATLWVPWPPLFLTFPQTSNNETTPIVIFIPGICSQTLQNLVFDVTVSGCERLALLRKAKQNRSRNVPCQNTCHFESPPTPVTGLCNWLAGSEHATPSTMGVVSLLP
ncbi:hypothetical protein Hanom_Chr01g00042251 [Helianthus anomalus]